MKLSAATQNLQRRLSESTNSLANISERLSSGQRINRASDDAAGLSIADSLRADSRIFTQGVRNLNDGISALNIASSAISQLTGIVTRITELAQQAGNGTLGYAQRGSLDSEAQALSAEYLRIIQSTKFNGLGLIDGSLGRLALQAGYSQISSGVGGKVGTGVFSRSSYSSGTSNQGLATGDLNGDGNLDFVVSNNNGSNLTVHLGNGDGTFRVSQSYASSQNGGGVLLGDLNGDGNLDIISSVSNGYEVMLGNGNGSFSEARTYDLGFQSIGLRLADINNDGVLDLAAMDNGGGRIVTLTGNGDGSFAVSGSFAGSGNPTGLALADINNDGNLDLIASQGVIGSIEAFLGDGTGNFGTPYEIGVSARVEVGDLNNDGAIDLVTEYGVILGNGNGTFRDTASFSLTLYDAPKVGDFNGDGILDLVGYFESNAYVFIGNGDGTFKTPVSDSAGAIPGSPILGDFNNDGVLDFIMPDTDTSDIYIFTNSTKDGVGALLPFSLSSVSDARQAMPILERALESLSLQSSVLGAFDSRLRVATKALETSSLNYRQAESRIRDADIASESAEYVRTQILQSTAAEVLKLVNSNPQIILKLLDVN